MGEAEAAEGTRPEAGVDKLETIFHWQQRFQDDLVARRGIDYDQRTWIQKQALALMVELGEVLEAAQFKWWKNPGPWDEAHLHEELVDVLHFYVAMCLAAGMTADDLYQGYLKKNQENFRRQQGLSEKAGYQAGAD